MEGKVRSAQPDGLAWGRPSALCTSKPVKRNYVCSWAKLSSSGSLEQLPENSECRRWAVSLLLVLFVLRVILRPVYMHLARPLEARHAMRRQIIEPKVAHLQARGAPLRSPTCTPALAAFPPQLAAAPDGQRGSPVAKQAARGQPEWPSRS